ncbi:LapB repeat-containing protein [Listeria ivanovii]|uniref:LapB repeat-containing protein n=3 Tax=Listeria ivanovii TaxID=1638 RepID=UPI00069D5A55|nr:LapB repeat-containing protein [Listeria ivanovii]
MKKIYLSIVIIFLFYGDMIPLAATVYAETNTPVEAKPDSNDTTVPSKTVTLKNDFTNSDPTGTTASKETNFTTQTLAAGDTYSDIFPDKTFAKIIALQITGSDNTSQVVTREQLDSVTTLNASAKNVTDITGINELTNLITADLSQNQLTSIVPVANLPSLKSLNVSSNLLSTVEIPSTQNIPNLTIINLSSNPTITKISIQDQSKLTIVSAIISSGQSSLLEELTLSNLPALTSVGINTYNDNYTMRFPNYSDVLHTVKLKSLPKIKMVDLERNAIAEIEIQDMSILNFINLHGNNLTDTNKLTTLPALTRLHLSFNQLTTAGISGLLNLDTLIILDLEANLLSRFELDTDNDLPNLTHLLLKRNPSITKLSIENQPKLALIDASIVAYQKSLLEELTLSNLPALTSAGKYTSYSVSFSGYSDALSTVKLNMLPNIRNADFNNNNISNIDVQDMTLLSSLSLRSNELANINKLVNLPLLVNMYINDNHMAILPTSLETEAPALTNLDATNQTIPLPKKVITSNLSIANEISNNGVISTPTTISNSGVYQNDNVTWEHENIQSLSSVSYNFNEPVKYSSTRGTFSGTVTQPITVSSIPIVTADDSISYPKFSEVTEANFLADIQATTSDGSSITSNFETVVNFTTPGEYNVTLNAVNVDGVTADPITITVTIEKAPAPIITTDNEITYMKHSMISPAEFLTDVHAATNDGSPIISDFTTVVDFETAGDYIVTLQSINSDEITANPISVTIHVEKDPAPIITADSDIFYTKNSSVNSELFYTDIQASTSDKSAITSDFKTVVDFTTPGNYTVTLQSVNEDGVAADPIFVTVHIEKASAPVISADSKVSYAEKSTVSSQQFYKDIHATTNDGSVITSNFDTVVNFQVAGDYKVTLRAVNEDGVAADPVFVTVHIEKASAPIISADSDISYKKNSKITIQQFYDSIHATTSDGSPITSDFESVVNFTVTGDYTVTLQSINSDGVAASPVQVIVHITANEPTPPDNDESNNNQPNHPAEKDQPNISLPNTGDTNNSLMGIVFLFIAFSILYVVGNNKKVNRK